MRNKTILFHISLILPLLCLFLGVIGCGGDETDDETSTSATYTWSGNVESIVTASCSQNGACHESSNGTQKAYLDQSVFTSAENKQAIQNRILGVGSIMPPADSGLSLSSSEKDIIRNYLDQSSQE